MDISKKLLFLLCIVSVGNIIAMDKQNLVIGENACYQMLRNQFHQPFDEANNKMQLGQYHGIVEETIKESFEAKGVDIGKIEINQIELGVDNESSTIYNSMYQSQHKLHFYEIPITDGPKTKHIYLIDVVPYEMMAMFAEKFNNYERIRKVISNNRSLSDDQKSNIQSEFDQEFVSNQLKDDIIAQRENLYKEREAIKKEKEEIERTFQEKIKESQEAAQKSMEKILAAEQKLQYNTQATFWNQNPKYAFGAGFLTCGLLCGLSVYHGYHTSISSFLSNLVGLLRRN